MTQLWCYFHGHTGLIDWSSILLSFSFCRRHQILIGSTSPGGKTCNQVAGQYEFFYMNFLVIRSIWITYMNFIARVYGGFWPIRDDITKWSCNNSKYGQVSNPWPFNTNLLEFISSTRWLVVSEHDEVAVRVVHNGLSLLIGTLYSRVVRVKFPQRLWFVF